MRGALLKWEEIMTKLCVLPEKAFLFIFFSKSTTIYNEVNSLLLSLLLLEFSNNLFN